MALVNSFSRSFSCTFSVSTSTLQKKKKKMLGGKSCAKTLLLEAFVTRYIPERNICNHLLSLVCLL